MNMLNKFIEYIGPEDSLGGYSRSYKLVFLISLLELISIEGKAQVIDVARSFKKFYEDRKAKGLLPDNDVEARVQNIEQSTISQIISVIKDNPYKVINQKGFVNIEETDTVEYFSLNSDLSKELTGNEKRTLVNTLSKKLKLYYSRIDSEVKQLQSGNHLKMCFEKIMNMYIKARTSESFEKHSIGSIIRRDIPKFISSLSFIDSSVYSIKGSCGQGNWATVPWVSILNKNITTTTQDGVYVVYLFSEDMERLYLTLNQGCTKLEKAVGKKEAIREMQQVAKDIRTEIEYDTDKIASDNNLITGNEFYEKGCIFYKVYNRDNIPNDNQLIMDLEEFIGIYNMYYQGRLNDSEEAEVFSVGAEKEELVCEYDINDEIDRISNYISNRGFTYADGLVKNFYLALKSKPFVILAGTSGTGKSKLVKLFAEAVGATSENGKFKLIAVRPDWSDSTDLLGYRDLNGRFHAGVLTGFIKNALLSPEEPHFICLDEMNLARVEYYLSDILSIMETRRRHNNKIITDRLLPEECIGKNEEDKQFFSDVILPDNLYIIGTVNMDETTFPFSKKVLDRANTIEFSYVDLDVRPVTSTKQIPSVALHNSFLRSEYLLLNECVNQEEIINETISVLKEINEVLYKANLHFGYRIRDEICYYIVYNNMYELMPLSDAMDNEILQKVLPRIQGSSMSIKRVLIDLFKICINNSTPEFNYENVGVKDEMFSYLNNTAQVYYRRSAEKISFMIGRFEEDGFTSYWM